MRKTILRRVIVSIRFCLLQHTQVWQAAPAILNFDASLKTLRNTRSSLSRFGEGEIKIMQGIDISFQKSTPILRERLLEIIKRPDPSNLLALPNIWQDFEKLTLDAQSFWVNHLLQFGKAWTKIQSEDYQYLDALITRPYMDMRLKSITDVAYKFKQWQMLWQDKSVLIVEGSKTQFGEGNDLLANAKQVKRILVPAQDAFNRYDDILATTKRNLPEFDLILLAIGPTATVLANDLAGKCQAIDVGHLDIEYEWFLKKARQKIVLKNRVVNEIHTDYQENDVGIKIKTSKMFQESIIARIA
ncbi:MAG: GT-D fold domain-containing protein [Streptococcaceae bacterium]|jgi:glycosyltransferase family protein|nr:GT-D fold domain-containing protein [Streptococcaceae bacterium]